VIDRAGVPAVLLQVSGELVLRQPLR